MREFFKENLSLKLASVLLALLLELHLVGPENALETSVLVGVRINNLPPTVMIVSPPGGERGIFVKCRLKGPRNLVERLEPFHQTFSVDLPDPVQLVHRIPLNPTQLRLDDRISVISMDPPTLELRLERVVKKELLVILDKVGEPPSGYRLKGIKLTPETVIARGPRSELEGLSIVRTQAFDLSGLRQTEKREVTLVGKGDLTSYSVDEITVDVDIEPVMSEKTYPKVVLESVLPQNLSGKLEPPTVKLVIAGPQTLFGEINEHDMHAVINAKDLPEGEHLITPEVQLPDSMKVVRIEPEKIKVTLGGSSVGPAVERQAERTVEKRK